MRQSAQFLLGLILLSQLFFACKKDGEEVKPAKETETPPSSQPGYFVISSIDQSYIANGRKSAETYDSEFDLGTLLSSDKFLFLIANGGDEPIFNVTLSSDNTPFDITPKRIQVVPGSKGSAIIPLLTVGVTHGVRLKGIGTAPNLPKGQNKATIRMTGKTLSGKDTVEVTGEFIVEVDAQVVDAKVLSGDMDPIAGKSFYGYPALLVEPSSKTVKIVNSGTVPIHVSFLYVKAEVRRGGAGDMFLSNIETKNEVELQPNETKDITSFVSPFNGDVVEGDLTYFYNGSTLVFIKPVKDEGVVANLTNLTLQTK